MITLVTILVLGSIACVVSRLFLQRETTFIKVLYIFYLVASFILSLYFILVFFWLFKLNPNICLVCAHFMYLLKIFVEAA